MYLKDIRKCTSDTGGFGWSCVALGRREVVHTLQGGGQGWGGRDVYLKKMEFLKTRRRRNQEVRTEWRDIHTHAHSSPIHKSLKMEATQAPTDWWMDKHSVVYTHNGVLVNLKKEGNSGVCYNISEPWYEISPSQKENRMIPLNRRYLVWSNS